MKITAEEQLMYKVMKAIYEIAEIKFHGSSLVPMLADKLSYLVIKSSEESKT